MAKKTTEEKLLRQLKNARRNLKRALPHDPDCENDMRAARARKVIVAYYQQTGEKRKDAVGDLLCDLMHLCDRDHRFRSFEKSLRLAEQRCREETAEPYS